MVTLGHRLRLTVILAALVAAGLGSWRGWRRSERRPRNRTPPSPTSWPARPRSR